MAKNEPCQQNQCYGFKLKENETCGLDIMKPIGAERI